MIAAPAIALRVRAIRDLAPTLKEIALEAADGIPLPRTIPGAHIALRIVGEERIHRNSYSIVGMSDDGKAYRLVVRRTADSRGGSHYIHERLKVGDELTSSPPNSQFAPIIHARKHLLIGGGVGITPLLSFLAVLRETGGRFEMHHFAKPEEVPVYEDLLSPHGSNAITIHVGRDCDIAAIMRDQPLGTHVYTCGPAALMETVEQAADDLGWPVTSVHRETFGSTGGRPFTIELASSGRKIEVGEHETMLEALEEAGVPVSSLCRGGACGECRSAVVSGTPDHRDHFLTDDEKAAGKYVMPCVSRACGATLVLDY